MEDERIRVFLAGESLVFRTAAAQALAGHPRLHIAGMAASAEELAGALPVAAPDLLVLACGVDGTALVRRARTICPVLALGPDIRARSGLLRAGAADFLLKPGGDVRAPAMRAFLAELSDRILAEGPAGRAGRAARSAVAGAMDLGRRAGHGFDGVVAIGASTGGTQSTAQILRALPRGFPGVVIVQHMPPTFTRLYADNLDKECALTVREARDGDAVLRGQVLIAPGDEHMRLTRYAGGGYGVRCVSGPKVNGHRPSVDELFFSVARCAGPNAIGVILTGMGADGALGLCEMRRQGAYTVGQDEGSSVVYGMPREAYEKGGVVKQAPLSQIADLLLRHIGKTAL